MFSPLLDVYYDAHFFQAKTTMSPRATRTTPVADLGRPYRLITPVVDIMEGDRMQMTTYVSSISGHNVMDPQGAAHNAGLQQMTLRFWTEEARRHVYEVEVLFPQVWTPRGYLEALCATVIESGGTIRASYLVYSGIPLVSLNNLHRFFPLDQTIVYGFRYMRVGRRFFRVQGGDAYE